MFTLFFSVTSPFKLHLKVEHDNVYGLKEKINPYYTIFSEFEQIYIKQNLKMRERLICDSKPLFFSSTLRENT